MTREIRADAVSDAVIRERREVIVTGHIVGHYAAGDGAQVLVVQMPADSLIQVGAPK